MKPSLIPNGYLGKLISNNRGQTLVEYGLLLVLVAVVTIAAVTFIGQKADNTYSKIGNTLPQP